jgi:hypothetical protein
LLVWDKGNYTGIFLVIYISQLIHLFIFLHFYLSPILVISPGLRILYSFLCREYTNHMHLLSFFLLTYPSHMWPVFNIIVVFVSCLYSTYERRHSAFGLLSLANII